MDEFLVTLVIVLVAGCVFSKWISVTNMERMKGHLAGIKHEDQKAAARERMAQAHLGSMQTRERDLKVMISTLKEEKQKLVAGLEEANTLPSSDSENGDDEPSESTGS